jgi:hypothetical protein
MRWSARIDQADPNGRPAGDRFKGGGNVPNAPNSGNRRLLKKAGDSEVF